MKLFEFSTVLAFAIGLSAIAFPATPQQDSATDSVAVVESWKLEFRIAQDKPGEGLVEAAIFDSDEKVYLQEDAGVTSDDIAHAFIVSHGEIQIEFTPPGAMKMSALTAANLGKRLAVIVDGRVISAPTIRAAVGDKAIVSGNFTIGEARKIARGIVTPPFHAFLVLIKSDWSQVDDAEQITLDLQRAMKDAAVPQSMLQELPASGTSILFPTEMVSLYTPQHYVDLLAWLKQRDLLVKIERFPQAEALPISTARGAEKMPAYTSSIGKPPAFLQLPGLPVITGQGDEAAEPEDSAKPFVIQRMELNWHVDEQQVRPTSSLKQLTFIRRMAVREVKRGQDPAVSRVLDQSGFECHIPGHHVAVMQAFPAKDEAQFRKAAHRLGFLPLIVTVPTKGETPKPIGQPIVRPPDIVEIVATKYGANRNFWPDPTRDGSTPVDSADDEQRQNPSASSADEARMTVELRLTYVDAGSVESTLKQLFHNELTVAADRRTNSLIARGSKTVLDEVTALIKKIDVAGQSANSPDIHLLETDQRKAPVPQASEIDRLRNEYSNSEKAARETAVKLLSSAHGSDKAKSEILRRQLRAQVASSFRIRQELHQAELETMKEKLQEAIDTIRQRDAIKDQIIDRRVLDLMNPRLEWDKPADPDDGTAETRPSEFTGQVLG